MKHRKQLRRRATTISEHALEAGESAEHAVDALIAAFDVWGEVLRK